ncbi:hypothetical protein B7463_g6864, partial [Scytalidium lignicola]
MLVSNVWSAWTGKGRDDFRIPSQTGPLLQLLGPDVTAHRCLFLGNIVLPKPILAALVVQGVWFAYDCRDASAIAEARDSTCGNEKKKPWMLKHGDRDEMPTKHAAIERGFTI